jgi:prolipoprotein diacylglyceryltransferase
MEKVFNMIFTGVLPSLFMSRLFYGILHAKNITSNLWTFILIPYYPGLSLLGAIVGVGSYFLFLAVRRKDSLPLARIFDFFSIAFLISLPIGFLGYLLFSVTRIEIIKVAIQAVIYFIIFIIFLKFFLPRLLTGEFKEGTMSLLFLIFFSAVSLVLNAFAKITLLGYFKNYENLILISTLLLAAGTAIWHENLIGRTKQPKKGNNGA